MKVNWEVHPWQCEASTTQLFPRSDGFAGNPIFSNISICEIDQNENKANKNQSNTVWLMSLTEESRHSWALPIKRLDELPLLRKNKLNKSKSETYSYGSNQNTNSKWEEGMRRLTFSFRNLDCDFRDEYHLTQPQLLFIIKISN